MNVHSCKIIDAVDLTEKEFSFAIVFGNPSSPNHYLFLRAASLSQKSKWVSALSSAASFEVPFSGWFPARSAPSKPAPLPVQANPVLGRFQVPFVQYLPVGVDAPREVTLEDGSVYRGSWLKGLAHGHGALQLASGRSYHGQWKVTQPNTSQISMQKVNNPQ
uniref:PH domain-containing protein n=1 Tax=Spongospora subterranea TaxID=70186 RepID=A0A0H5RV50_9EUKA|eukprot:CRZ12629.1 hypothetical protein [Spongospora subterranea]